MAEASESTIAITPLVVSECATLKRFETYFFRA